MRGNPQVISISTHGVTGYIKTKKRVRKFMIKNELKGSQLVLTIDLDGERRPSSTGKSDIIATTSGFQGQVYKGENVKYMVNVIVPNK